MIVDGQPHTPPALPLGKMSSVPREQKAGWASFGLEAL